MVVTNLMTAEDLLTLSSDRRCELIRGELFEMPPAGDEHGDIAFEIAHRISLFLGNQPRLRGRFADTGFIVRRNPDTVLAPDVAFIDPARFSPDRDRRGYVDGAPDLAVEVISPSDRFSDVNDKVQLYLEAGSQLVWLVDPRRRVITVYSADRTVKEYGVGDTLDGGALLPGFAAPVAEIFR